MTKRDRWNAAQWANARLELWLRAKDRCEFCGRPLHGAGEVHHRRMRSQGGRDAMDNLALVHAACHRWAHANPKSAYERGWLVQSWAEPGQVPVVVVKEGMP